MKKLRIKKTPKGSPKATWKMTTPVMVPNGFQPVTDPMSLYSAATGMSATCNGTTIRPTIVRKTALRPRHLPNTME